MNTPWGESQSIKPTTLAGVVFVTTTSHGGYYVPHFYNLKIPKIARSEDGWYEEDCDWAIVHLVLLDTFGEAAKRSISRWQSPEICDVFDLPSERREEQATLKRKLHL